MERTSMSLSKTTKKEFAKCLTYGESADSGLLRIVKEYIVSNGL